MLFLLFCLILAIEMTGYSCSVNGGGGTTPSPQTPTQKLVGTWNFVSGIPYTGSFVFRADGTGSCGGSNFHAGRIDNGVFYFTLESGQNEAFDITWNSDNNITLTNGNSYTYSRAS
jgi:hypothetical protein